MYLFLEILWVKKCCNLKGGGGIFPCHCEYFPCAKSGTTFFFEIICLSGICENITDDVHKMK